MQVQGTANLKKLCLQYVKPIILAILLEMISAIIYLERMKSHFYRKKMVLAFIFKHFFPGETYLEVWSHWGGVWSYVGVQSPWCGVRSPCMGFGGQFCKFSGSDVISVGLIAAEPSHPRWRSWTYSIIMKHHEPIFPKKIF